MASMTSPPIILPKLCSFARFSWRAGCIAYLCGRMLPRRAVPHVVFAITFVVVVLIARQWAYVTTYRLYLDHVAGESRRSTATQHFDVENRRVVPSVATRGTEV